VGRKGCTIVFADAPDQTYVKAAHKHPLPSPFNPRRRVKILNQNEIGTRFMPGVSLVFGDPRPRGVVSFLNFHRHLLQPGSRAGKGHWPSA